MRESMHAARAGDALADTHGQCHPSCQLLAPLVLGQIKGAKQHLREEVGAIITSKHTSTPQKLPAASNASRR